MIFDKGAKMIQYRKDDLFNKWCWNNGFHFQKEGKKKKKKKTSILTSCFIQIQLKMDHWPKYKTENYKASRRKQSRENLNDHGLGQDFLNKIPKPQIIKWKNW